MYEPEKSQVKGFTGGFYIHVTENAGFEALNGYSITKQACQTF